MKQTNRRVVVAIMGITSGLVCVLLAISGNFTRMVMAGFGDLTPPAIIYLPFINNKTMETPTATQFMPVCTPPLCATDEGYYCPGVCPGGCGTICVTSMPVPPTLLATDTPTPTDTATSTPTPTFPCSSIVKPLIAALQDRQEIRR